MGHSYGGFLCLLLAIREPALVRTLVVAEPPVVTLFVSDPPKPAELLRLLFTRPRTAAAIVKFGALGVGPATKAFRRGDVEKGVEIFGGAVFGSGGFAGLPDERRSQVLDNLTNVRAEILGSGFAPLAADELRGLGVPTLLLTGERSIPLFQPPGRSRGRAAPAGRARRDPGRLPHDARGQPAGLQRGCALASSAASAPRPDFPSLAAAGRSL